MKMVKSLSVTMVLLVLAISTFGQDGWIKRVSSEGKYSVEMPAGNPSITTRRVLDADGNEVVQHSMAVNEGLTRFIVGYYDYGASMKFSSSGARDSILDRVNGKLVSDKTAKIGDLPTRTLKILAVANGVDIVIMARLYSTRSRVYLIQVIFPKFEEGAVIDTKVKTFFDSFAAAIVP